MNEYHKILTVYTRDPETRYKYLIDGQFAKPEFEYLAGNNWVWTEKIDGTNIRVMWDGENVRFGGKSDKAQIPATLISELQNMFCADLLTQEYPDTPMCLYGEGYGAKIQKGGGDYIPDGQSFILFDIRIGDVWLERSNVEDIAGKLGIKTVPQVGYGSLNDAIELVRYGAMSDIAKVERIAEGIVARPASELLDRLGHRIITKIKYKDFPRDA